MTTETPIDMVLHCPACGTQHIDAPEAKPHVCEDDAWTNPPHKSHLCHGCGHIWRPADVPTNGVRFVKTVGKADHPIHSCRAGHVHKWADMLDSTGRWVGSKCKHCGDAIPF